MPIIPEFPNEVKPGNPVVAIDLRMKDHVVLRFELGEVQQSRVMWAMRELLLHLGVGLDISLPETGHFSAVAKALTALVEAHDQEPSMLTAEEWEQARAAIANPRNLEARWAEGETEQGREPHG